MFNAIYTVIGTPLGWIMWACYHLIPNYGIALLVFTLIIRSAMLPLSIKQQKASAKMQMIQPKLAELQKKYANNREKLGEEMNKLYKKENYNPTSGCLPMLIPLVIMFGLIDVIYRPLKHILHLSGDIIANIEQIALNLGLVSNISGLNSSQILAAQSMRENVTPWIEGGISQDIISKIDTLNLNFFGMNLGLTPNLGMFSNIFAEGHFNPLLLIPILSGVTALISTLVMMRNSAANNQMAGGGSMKIMMLMMPIFSFMIAFNVPAGVGLYWAYSNLYAIGQSLLLNKFYNPKELAEQVQKEYEERQERERQERIEAKKQAKLQAKEGNKGEQVDEKVLSQKEINRRKLAEARRRDAERYGETYVEVTDDDLQ